MSFPRYAEYKDSGVEWLGEVPAHWTLVSFRRLASIRYGIGEPPPYRLEGIPLIRATNVHAGMITPEGLVLVDPDEIPEKRAVWLQPGDIIVVRSGAYTGDSAIVRERHCPSIAGFDMVVRPHSCDSDFLQYSLLSRYLKNDQIDLEKLRAAQPHLNAEELGACFVVAPTSSEQAAIAAFLDHETGKIDALVAEQEKLIALLKEKRQAVISHAVTKGLNPDAPMKPSGIEWLGDVPAHWELGRLADLCHFRSGKAHEPFVDDGGKFVCVNSRFVSTEGASRKYCTENLSPARRGDVLMVMSDLPNGRALAKAFFVDDDGAYAVNQRVCSLTARNGEGRFFFYLLDRNQEFLSYDDGMNQTHLPNSAFEKFKVFAPPAYEQRQIAEALTDFCANVAALSDKAEHAITLLKERRNALISAAVTGQIDVRATMSSVGS